MKFKLNKIEIRYIINIVNNLLKKQENDPINFKDIEILNFYILLIYHLEYNDFLYVLDNINNLSLFTIDVNHIYLIKNIINK